MKNLVLPAFLGVLMSCMTVDTFVENADTAYVRTPLVVTQSLLNRSIALGGYSLVLETSISHQRQIGKDGDWTEYNKTSGGSYGFYREKERLCTVEVFRNADYTTDGKVSQGTSSDFIRIVRNGTSEYEISDRFGSDLYLKATSAGHTFDFNRYYRDSSGTSHGIFRAMTGFSLAIDGTEYGVLALYRTPVFYELKTAAVADPALRDEVALFTLAVYESSVVHKPGF